MNVYGLQVARVLQQAFRKTCKQPLVLVGRLPTYLLIGLIKIGEYYYYEDPIVPTTININFTQV